MDVQGLLEQKWKSCLFIIFSYLADQLPRLGKRELIGLLSFTCLYSERFLLPLSALSGLS